MLGSESQALIVFVALFMLVVQVLFFIAVRVIGPATPLAEIPFADWNAFTADSDTQNKKDVVTFLTENVTNIDDFKILLKELVTLFGDLLASLSDETIAKGLEAQTKLQAQKTAPKPVAK